MIAQKTKTERLEWLIKCTSQDLTSNVRLALEEARVVDDDDAGGIVFSYGIKLNAINEEHEPGSALTFTIRLSEEDLVGVGSGDVAALVGREITELFHSWLKRTVERAEEGSS